METLNIDVVNMLRLLSSEMIENAGSGHPGMPLGCSPMMYILWFKIMNHNPKNPFWINRDRFVLSNGHGCALLYATLYLSGFTITLNDLKNLRKIGSITPGHPEKGLTPGVEVTTGPLGQGFANGVGMAIASKNLKSTFNTKDIKLIDNYVYVMCGDGCLMEGITNEAASLAGTLKLDNLIVLYDDNNITIDGSTELTFTEDVSLRFKSLNWDVFTIEDGDNDLDCIYKTLLNAKLSKKPVLIRVKTTIGYSTINQGKCKIHGSPVGENEIKRLRKEFGFDKYEMFEFPNKLIDYCKNMVKRGEKNEAFWNEKLNEYKNLYPEKYSEFLKFSNNDKINCNFLPSYTLGDKEMSTRDISGECMEKIVNNLSNLMVGSADLSSSNRVLFKQDIFNKNNYSGSFIHYGVREHAMSAISNGISTYGIIPISATYLGFINYFLAGIRLSALSKHKVICVLTHDSVALGEDGPTHQPVESLTILRSIPDLLTFRPADGNETAVSYELALNNDGPSCICLARQKTGQMTSKSQINDIKKGGYILYQNCEDDDLRIIVIATGSEVYAALKAIKKNKYNTYMRLVSIPCVELFEKQDFKYKSYVLPKNIIKISFEAGSTLGWYKYADYCYGINEFGKSGNGEDVLRHFELTSDKIYEKINKL